MVATHHRVQVTVPKTSAIPADAINNTWHFILDNSDAETFAGQVETALDGFYTAINGIWATDMDWANGTYEWFNLATSRPRLAWRTTTMSVTAGDESLKKDLPAEVAIVLSFRAAYASGVNSQRRRGRLFLGPLAYFPSANVDLKRPTSGSLGVIQDAANDLLAASQDAAGDWTWCILSRSDFGGLAIGERPEEGEPFPENPALLAGAMHEVVAGWLDDAWDTQRRRGILPSDRFAFDGTPL